ncbi:hypothetical protein [Streptomyces cirratus]|uniref:hypothetical protein n=1 Tax=Streptomyces cirratus TaxID=68187 RepID=UPI0036064E6C
MGWALRETSRHDVRFVATDRPGSPWPDRRRGPLEGIVSDARPAAAATQERIVKESAGPAVVGRTQSEGTGARLLHPGPRPAG